MRTQFGWRIYQTHGVTNMVVIPISRPQTVYKTLIMTTQTNKSMGWPLPIPINCERQKIELVVNPKVGVPMAKPYWSALKYPNYKKNVDQMFMWRYLM